MKTCKEISALTSDYIDNRLPWYARLGVRMHLLMCRHCKRFVKQMQLLRQNIGNIVADEEMPEKQIETLMATIKSHAGGVARM